jgi:hypothetical protein
MTRGDGKTTILRDIQYCKATYRSLRVQSGRSGACKRPSSLSRSVGARPGQWLDGNFDVSKVQVVIACAIVCRSC